MNYDPVTTLTDIICVSTSLCVLTKTEQCATAFDDSADRTVNCGEVSAGGLMTQLRHGMACRRLIQTNDSFSFSIFSLIITLCWWKYRVREICPNVHSFAVVCGM